MPGTLPKSANLRTALLVDDDPEFLETAKRALGNNEMFVLDEVATGYQAIDLIKAIDFSVALIDLELSGHSGFDVIEKIHDVRPTLPIIAISGVSSWATLESAKELGATDVLKKPITPEWPKLITRLSGSSPITRKSFT